MSAVSAGAQARLRAIDQGQRPRHALLLSVCCLAQFMVILDVSIVNVALPTIQRSLGFAQTDLQWVVNAYAITFAGFLMLSGRAADLLGGRRTFVTGLLLFALASLVGGTAADRHVLLGARALQGLGGAIMAASSLAIITSSFAAGPERHRAIALWGAMNGAGGAAGTLLGGIITQELSWRWVLLINLPIGIAAALIARAVVVDRPREPSTAGFDVAGALAVTLGMLSLVYGIVNAGPHGWGSPSCFVPIAVGLALLAAFVVIEGRFAAAPLVPLRVFSNRLIRASNLVVVAFSAALFPMWYFCSLYLQDVLRFGPLDTGLAFLPMALTIMACATQAGGLVARFGAGPVLTGGLSLMAVGLALFARISVNGSYLSDFLLPSLLASVGVGFSVVPSTIAATASVAPGEAGLASGLVNTSRQMGGALGLAILASLAVLYTDHLVSVDYRAPILALNDGFRLAFLLGACFTAAGAVIALKYIPRSVRPPGPPLAPVRDPARAASNGDIPAAPARPGSPPPEPPPETARSTQTAEKQDIPPETARSAVSPQKQDVRPAPPARPTATAQAAAAPTSSVPEPGPAPSGAATPDAARGLIAVAFTLSDGGRWPLAPGAMTVRLGGAGRPGRAGGGA